MTVCNRLKQVLLQLRSRRFLLLTLIQIVAILSAVLDIPVARQIIVFAYLTFVPGIVILYILRFRGYGIAETVLLSAGLSIAFLMFAGLLINEFYPPLGISQPISTLPLMITINIALLFLNIVSLALNKDPSSDHAKNLFSLASLQTHLAARLTRRKLFSVSLILCLPVLSILGVLLRNNSGNISVLLLLILVISALIVLSTSSRIFDSALSDLLPLIIVMIAASLVYLIPLTFTYLTGFDIHLEYYVFELTKESGQWTSIPSAGLDESVYNSLLSITILPTIFSNLLNLSEVWVFKILYPSILTLVPLGLYYIYKMHTSKMIAFLSTAFFMAGSFFYSPNMLSLLRQIIAELFLVLLVYSLLNKKLTLFQGSVLKVTFLAALIFSHYATSYFFTFIIFSVWIVLLLPLIKAKKNIAPDLPILVFTMTFVWYISISNSGAFQVLSYQIQRIFTGILDGSLLRFQARDQLVQRTFGLAESLMRNVHSRIQNLTQFFIVLGFIKLIRKRKEITNARDNFDQVYLSMCFVSLAIIAMSIVLPNFNNSFQMHRLYYLVLIFLSPLFVLGGEFFFDLLSKLTRILPPRRRKQTKISGVGLKPHKIFLVSIVLISFFLFESGFIYAIYGDFSDNIVLSQDKVDKVVLYNTVMPAKDVYSAKWLRNYKGPANVYADEPAITHVLKSYGLLPSDDMVMLTKFSFLEFDHGTYIYLREFNVDYGIIIGKRTANWNTTDVIPEDVQTNLLYSNGGSEILQKP